MTTRSRYGGPPLANDVQPIGRATEIDAAVDALRAGSPVLVVGAAGLGKTTVLAEVVERRGGAHRYGCAADFLQGVPWLVLRRAVGEDPPGTDVEDVADWVHTSLGSDLIVLDDLQWADSDSLDALGALAARRTVLAATRPGGSGERVRAACTEAGFAVIDLRPLPPEVLTLVLEGIDDAPPERAARAELAQRAGGSPLLARLLALGGGRLDRAGSDVVGAIVAQCSPAARRALTRWGLGGPPLPLEAPGAAELVDRGLAVAADGGVLPLADLLTEVAAEAAPDAERRYLHRTLAQAASDPTVAATHWFEAGELALAADAARWALRHPFSEHHAARLAGIVGCDPGEPAETLRDAVTRLLVAADPDEAARVLDLGDPDRRRLSESDRCLVLGVIAAERSDPDEATRLLGDALALAEAAGDRVAVAHVLSARAAAHGKALHGAAAYLDAVEAVKTAEACGAPSGRARYILAGAELLLGNDAWRSSLPAAYDHARAEGDRELVDVVGWTLAWAWFLDLQTESALALVADLEDQARRKGTRRTERELQAMRATNRALSHLGSPSVEAELRALLADPAMRNRGGVTAFLAMAMADRGELAGALGLVEAERARAAASDLTTAQSLAWAAAEVHWLAGDPVSCLREARRGRPPEPSSAPAGSANAVLERWARLEQGTLATANDLPPVHTPFEAFRGLVAEAKGLDLLAVPGREGEAAETLVAAAELHDRYFHRGALRARLGAALAWTRAGEARRAADLWDGVRAVAGASGLVAWTARMARLCGEPPTVPGSASSPVPARSNGQGGLSPRQREVLDLVQQGRSSAEIAVLLGIGVSTVDTHIQSAMRRLGAANRREAARLALHQA